MSEEQIHVDRVREYIRTHVHRIERVEDVAEGLGVDPFHLREAYRRQCDDRVWMELLRYRVRYATRMIADRLRERTVVSYDHLQQSLDMYRQALPAIDETWPGDVRRMLADVHEHMFRVHGTGTAPRDIRVADIQKRTGLWNPRAPGLFRSYTGVSINAYIDRHRTAVAEVLLAHTDRRIDDIAEMLGYPARSSFDTAFKRIAGLTPISYRQSMR